jgi:2-keto-4-pentenoate hydratase/2-oxohepta-3-ene-1,7-dioic acid hydratase in catechol pathway
MKLATFVAPGEKTEKSGEVRDGIIVAFRDSRSIRGLLSDGSSEPADGRTWELSEVELLAPILRPRAIFCVGLNYKSHIEETGRDSPDRPLIFLKQPGSSISGNGQVRRPAIVTKLDYEGELAVVIGRDGHAAGYAIADDVTARDLQRSETQWTRAKGADDFCPWGPWITTIDEIPDPSSLSIRTWVNGQLRQDFNTRDLIFGTDEIITFLSETMTLQPGDVLLTGTGSGVGERLSPPEFLQPGDRVRVAIDGLGEIEHEIVENS